MHLGVDALFNLEGIVRKTMHLNKWKRERGFSSAGRAPALQAGGQRFDPANLHQEEVIEYGPIAQLARAHD